MASDLEKKAKKAFVDDDFELAVDLYSQALELDPANDLLYADRAQAYIKLDSFTEAVSDATKAIQLDPSMSKAYFRKGTACMKLEEYQTAKAALEAGAALVPEDNRFIKLIKECDERIAEEAMEIPPATTRPVTVAVRTTTISSTDSSSNANSSDSQALSNSTGQSVAVPSKPRFRHDYYNSTTEVVLTIFAKGIPKENVSVDFGEQTVCTEKANAGSLTNFEVFDFLRSRGATSDPMGCLCSVSPSECKVFEYLNQTSACMQTRKSVNEFLIKAEKFKLTNSEKLNLVNLTPRVLPALYAMIDDCENRLAKKEKQSAEEDQVQELLELVKEIFPQPAEEPQEELPQ